MIHQCLDQYTCLAANINFNLEGLRNGFWQLTIDGLSWGAIYALVAVGYTLVFGVLRLINFAHSEIFMLGMFGAYFCLDIILGFTPSGNVYNKGVALTVLYLGVAMLFAMLVSGSAAVGLEFIAYRPLRKRGARSLTFLITAIGMSFVLQEFVHFVLPKLLKGYGGSNAQQPIILMQPKTQFTIFGATVSNVTLVIIASALIFALLTDMAINRTKFGRGIRAVAQDPTTATLMGVSRERIIMTDVPARRPAGRCGRAAVHAQGAPGHHLLRRLPARHQGVLRRGARWHRQPARRTSRWPAARNHGELRAGGVRHPVARRGRLRTPRSGAADPADRNTR